MTVNGGQIGGIGLGHFKHSTSPKLWEILFNMDRNKFEIKWLTITLEFGRNLKVSTQKTKRLLFVIGESTLRDNPHFIIYRGSLNNMNVASCKKCVQGEKKKKLVVPPFSVKKKKRLKEK